MKSVSYRKELTWEISEFEDWWSSRDLAPSERSERAFTTWEEELQNEIPSNWSQASKSPIIEFEVDGIKHEFNLAILKYQRHTQNEICKKVKSS